MDSRPRRSTLAALLCLLACATGTARATDSTAVSQRPAAATGTTIIPDHFLRRWDPVTIFFDKSVGPKKPGPEDHPERLLKIQPRHPGAFTWLDAQTLQFKPAIPWPPLARVSWTVNGQAFTLITLMSAPTTTVPPDNAIGLMRLDTISLTFAEPLEVESLVRMLTLELRPVPGVDARNSRWLTRDDFEIKTMERHSPNDPATYVVHLHREIPLGTQATAHLRLSLDDRASDSFARLSFSTAEPFRIVETGCRSVNGDTQNQYQRRQQFGKHSYPISQDGSVYDAAQALDCGGGSRELMIDFSSKPLELGPVVARNLVHITPPVDNLTFELSGNTLLVRGTFSADQIYKLSLQPTTISDEAGRPLDLRGESSLHFFFPHREEFLRWGVASGIIERFGPQSLPLSGRGEDRVDLRVYSIDPLDRSLWPFPASPVFVDESQRPPGPGEEPTPHTSLQNVSTTALPGFIQMLGAPPFSQIVPLPLRRGGSAATFGLDVAAPLTHLSGAHAPGHYLVGARQLDRSNQRSWMRLQTTDLSLSTLEEPHAVRVVVTSLASAMPVRGATVDLQGIYDKEWKSLASGTTDDSGAWSWRAPGEVGNLSPRMRRIVVRKDRDVLVLDPEHAPDQYADNHWAPSAATWLQWAFEPLTDRGPKPELLCHLFSERPVYRPQEEIYLKGYLRERAAGELRVKSVDTPTLVVNGPGEDNVWRLPVTLSAYGSFDTVFQQANLPTGEYKAHLENKKEESFGEVRFRVEAYRIPTFEVQLNAPEKVPLDQEFNVKLLAQYYAGGSVSRRPISWRVTQFPYVWSPSAKPGFVYSSDSRFSGNGKFDSTPKLERDDVTDDSGASELTLNPAIEPSAQPRRYIVEATVTGADDQTVTNTKHVLALPPFVLGIKAPRYIEKVHAIEPEAIVVGPNGELVTGVEVTVRLLSRQWHSHLRASDFTDGTARYVTEIVDEKVSETTFTSEAAAKGLSLPIDHPGVYIVQLEARDKLNRSQIVSVDLYAAGDEPVSWNKPATRVFDVATDKPTYNPGETAQMVLKSPFQEAHALVVVEAPDGNHYEWLDVKGGSATYPLKISKNFVPRVPVHFVLMRGRLAEANAPTDQIDLGRPTTMAATSWVSVEPTEHRLQIGLEYAEKALPRDKVPITIRLRDAHAKPLGGEVTLWLVDQAVLALGKEQRLDPLPDFITNPQSFFSMHDTRNMVFGWIPFADSPGGSGGEGEEAAPFDKMTVRRSFKPVPYWNPSILVGNDGVATVTVELPDNLTNFKIRAKAVSGGDRFGFATGNIAVRKPVVSQAAMPRFVRPGDSFTAAVISRVVEGDAGAARVGAWIDGTAVPGVEPQITLSLTEPSRVEFPIEVATPPYTADCKLSRDTMTVKVATQRIADKAGDAVEVELPIRDDRDRVALRVLLDLQPGIAATLPALTEEARPGTVRRSLIVSDQPALVRMAAGLDFMRHYPHSCTEQRLSQARVHVALKQFRRLLKEQDSPEHADKPVNDFVAWLPQVVDDNGLCAFWPGTQGSVSLTAWSVQFLTEAKAAGYTIEAPLYERLIGSLNAALRSDYSHFVRGEAFLERAWALSALTAAGRADTAYTAELARRSQFLNLEATAQIAQALAATGDKSSTLDGLIQKLWDGLTIRLYQGHEVYGGLQHNLDDINPKVLPSETRTLAEVTRAIARTEGGAKRLPLLVNALVALGRGDGWGSTNANAAALSALAAVLEPPFAGSSPHTIALHLDDDGDSTLAIGPQAPLTQWLGTSSGNGTITSTGDATSPPVIARAEISYIPAADGSQVSPVAGGFVVSRELQRVAVDETIPPERIALSSAGMTAKLVIGDVVEEHLQLVNPLDHHSVAVVLPFAAGVEPLNPNLATAPAAAKPSGQTTLTPTYVMFLDDRAAFYYDELPKGTYDFYVRTRATTAGKFIQPAAFAELMYDGSVRGNSAGARIEIERQ